MKVLFFLLVTFFWVHPASAQATHSLYAMPVLDVQQSNPGGEASTKNQDANKKANELLAGVTWQTILVSILLSLTAAGIAYWLALKTSHNKTKELLYAHTLTQNRDNRLQENSLPVDKESSKIINQIRNDIKDIFARVNDQEKWIKELRDRNETLPHPLVIPEEVPLPVELKMEYFFLSTPNANGSFNESSATVSYKEGASIYKFTKEAFDKATFRIDEREASVRLAVQYPDKNIDPVCEAMNAYNGKATRIVTREPGSVELQGDKWVLKQKAKISYEG